jgi:hypothetical protein
MWNERPLMLARTRAAAMRDAHAAPAQAVFPRRFATCFLTLVSLPLVCLYILPRAPQNGWWWDILMGTGMLGAGLMLAIPVLSPRVWVHFGGDARHLRFLARLHIDVAYAVAILAAIHTTGLLILDPTLIEYLKLSAPWSMLAALAALVLILISILSSLYRIELNLRYRTWRSWHVGLSVTAMGLMTFHVIDAGYFLNSAAKTISFVVLVAGPSLVAFGIGGWHNIAQDNEHKPDHAGVLPLTLPATRGFSMRLVGLLTLLWLASIATLAIPEPDSRAEVQAHACAQSVCG